MHELLSLTLQRSSTDVPTRCVNCHCLTSCPLQLLWLLRLATACQQSELSPRRLLCVMMVVTMHIRHTLSF